MGYHQLSELGTREPMAGFVGRFIHSERATLVYWAIKAGAQLPVHSHPHEQIVNMLEGEFELTIDGQTRRLTVGAVAVIPPNAVHSGRSLTECRILDVFCPVREDYRY